MGGARCSYRNCTIKTDGVNHLFHYPVFDRVRCHQWLTNAQKLNFINLKLSQLKNRLICQHHFTDESFMNSLKKKLVNNAVPTLNGPFCTQRDTNPIDVEGNKEGELPINVEDIENELLPVTEKKAQFSLKYGDFLTNDVSDTIMLEKQSPKKKSTSIVAGDLDILFNRSSYNYFGEKYQKPKLINVFQKDLEKTDKRQPRYISNTKTAHNELIPQEVKYVELNFDSLRYKPRESEYKIPTLQPDNKQTGKDIQSMQILSNHQNKPLTNIPPTKRVKIISEKHISEPLLISKGEFQTVSPSVVISVPRRKDKSNVKLNEQPIPTLFLDNIGQSQNSLVDIKRDSFSCNAGSLVPNSDVSTFSHNVANINDSQTIKEDIVEDVKPVECLEIDLKPSLFKMDSEMLTSEHDIPPTRTHWTITTCNEHPALPLVDSSPVCTTVNETSYTHNLTETDVSATNLQNTDTCSTIKLAPKTSLVKKSQLPTVKTTNSLSKVSKNKNSDSKIQSISKNSPTKSIKIKIPPEKLAEIEEKRKYNMKLKDILGSCLSNIDEEPEAIKLDAIKKKEMNNKKVSEHLADVSKQDNNIAYLESRLQRLEDTLLNKIDQNAQNIADLKKILKPKITRKCVSTQTYQTAEVSKKNLYEQISQYLSADASSLIYEELFLNSCVSKPRESPRKRRRRI